MSFRDRLGRATGADFLAEAMEREQVLLEWATGKKHALPTEAGPRVAARLYWRRVETTFAFPGVLVLGTTREVVDVARVAARKVGEALRGR